MFARRVDHVAAIAAVICTQLSFVQCPSLPCMDANAWQALAARMMAAQQPPPASFWQALYSLASVPNQAQASSSSQGASAYGYPGSGMNSNQSASDAALSYAAMLQLSEQARLIAAAENQMQPPSTSAHDADLKAMLREVVRTEMKDFKAKDVVKEKKEKPADADELKKVEQHNQTEDKLDRDRRMYEESRAEETKRSDRRAVQMARDAYLAEQKEKEKEQASNKTAPAPAVKSSLRCCGGYKVQGGFIEVFSKFKPHHTICKSPGKDADQAVATDSEPEKTVPETSFRSPVPVEPPYPPHLPGPPPDGINMPPPPVDITKKNKRHLVLLQSVTCASVC